MNTLYVVCPNIERGRYWVTILRSRTDFGKKYPYTQFEYITAYRDLERLIGPRTDFGKKHPYTQFEYITVYRDLERLIGLRRFDYILVSGYEISFYNSCGGSEFQAALKMYGRFMIELTEVLPC